MECGEDDVVVTRRVEGQVPHEELGQGLGAPAGGHLRHGAPEVGVRVVRVLHHRRGTDLVTLLRSGRLLLSDDEVSCYWWRRAARLAVARL